MENIITSVLLLAMLSITVIGIIETIKDVDKKAKKQTKPIKIDNNENRKYYEKKRYLITKSEYILYKKLIQICNKYDLIVNSQVPLYQIVEIKINKNGRNYLKYFNKIRSKSVDFVIMSTF